MNQDDKHDLGYGWLSPDGTYIECPWGHHDEFAIDIIKRMGMEAEWRGWRREIQLRNDSRVSATYGDFLVQKKGYCLIDDPSYSGIDYYVTYTGRLTKSQKRFLFEYFYDKGHYDEARQYMD